MSEKVQKDTSISVQLDTGDWVVLETAKGDAAASTTYTGTVELSSLTAQSSELHIVDYVPGAPAKTDPAAADFAADLQSAFVGKAKDILGNTMAALGDNVDIAREDNIHNADTGVSISVDTIAPSSTIASVKIGRAHV